MGKKMSGISLFYMILVFSFMYLPIAVLAFFSFNSTKSQSVFAGFSFKWYEALFQDSMVLSALGVSLVIAAVSSVAATLLGTLASVGIFSMKKASRTLVMNVSYMPIINPEIITGVSMMLLFVVLKMFFGSGIFGIPSLLIAHITFNTPYVIFNVSPKLRQLDVSQWEAAQDLGCTSRQAFFKVVLPEISPAIWSSFLICLTYSIDDFIISYFTSGTVQTLPIAIYSMTRKKVSPEINALSAILFAAIFTIILLVNARDSRKEKKKRLAASTSM